MGTHPFPYRLIRSNRKTLAIQVSASGQVTVRAPRTMSDTTIENFLTQKESWILKHLSHAASEPVPSPGENRPLSDFRRSYYMESARKIFKRKTAAYAKKMSVTYGRITIREQKTRWGSCTPKTGRIRLNLQLAGYPEVCLEYILVHELAHLRIPNHSPAFWKLVEEYIPNWKEIRRQLRG